MKDTEGHEDGELLEQKKVEWVDEPDNTSDDLEDTDYLDESNESATDTEEHQTDDKSVENESKAEQAQDTFELDEPEGVTDKGEKEPSKAEAVKERQLNAWERDIKSGKKSLDDLPENLNWMKSDLETRLNEPEPSIDDADDIDSRIEKRLQEREDRKVFESLKTKIPEVADPAKQKGIREDYVLNRKEGLSQRRALELAMKANGVSPTEEPKTKAGVRIPKAGFVPNKGDKLSNHQISKLEDEHGWDEVRKRLSPQQQNAYLDWQGQDKNQYI